MKQIIAKFVNILYNTMVFENIQGFWLFKSMPLDQSAATIVIRLCKSSARLHFSHNAL